MEKQKILQELIESGIKAPSSHNTQPWLFKLKENEVQIHPDFKRALPIVDGDHHELYISLGCAAENIIIAAREKGISTNLELFVNSEGKEFIIIYLQESNTTGNEDELFSFITRRQVTRNEYSQKKIPQEYLKKLKKSFDFPGIKLLIFSEKKEIDGINNFIKKAIEKQYKDKEFLNELVDWIRFSKSKAKKSRDGVWIKSMGIPNIGSFLGNFVFKYLLPANFHVNRWSKLVKSSSALAIFVATKNDTKHWVSLGRAFQRFRLTATKLNIKHTHMNMPCEELEIRKKMAKYLNLDSEPLLLLRIGYSEEMPYSFRRNLEEVIN